MKAAFKYFFLWMILAAIGALLFALPAVGIADIVGNPLADYESVTNNPWAFSIIFLGVDLVPLLFFWKMKYARFSFKFDYDFGSSFSVKKLYIWAAVGAIGCLLLDLVFSNYIQFPEWDTEGLEVLGEMAENPIGLLSICLLGPLVEETVFRGAIERRLLEKPWNPWYAIVISAIFFASAHGNFTQGLTAMIIGCFMGWVYYRTRNLWPCVFIHALNNTAACVLGFILAGTSYEDADKLPHTVCAVMLVASVVMIYFAVKAIAQMTRDRTPLVAPVEVPPLPDEATFQPGSFNENVSQSLGTSEELCTPIDTTVIDQDEVNLDSPADDYHTGE